jgi:hypothetical protein
MPWAASEPKPPEPATTGNYPNSSETSPYRIEPFRSLWGAHEVKYYRRCTQPFRHPAIGDLDLDYDAFEIPRPWVHHGAYTAPSGSAARDRLDLLSSWATETALAADSAEAAINIENPTASQT